MILLKKGNVFGPEKMGVKDIFIAGKEIVAIEDEIDIDINGLKIIDCTDKNIYPGFIDGHVHIAGGGGEGSFKTKTPEVNLSDITKAGVTTVVGCLGTDVVTRNLSNLIAKANALEEEGISTFVYTGSYQIPIKTLFSTIQEDIVLIDKIIGVGEVAISDHRSSVPTLEEFAKIVSSAKIGGMLSGKSGIVNVHLGDGSDELDLIYKVKEKSELSYKQFLPTHMNRNKSLFKAAIKYGKDGGFIDFTTSTTKQYIEMGEIPCAKALKISLDEGVADTNITFTSDGQGSLPVFDDENNLIGLKIGRLDSLYGALVDAISNENIAIEIALKTITSNPADILKLENKGRIKKGKDGDIVIVDSNTHEIETVIAKGKIMVENKKVLVKGTFE